MPYVILLWYFAVVWPTATALGNFHKKVRPNLETELLTHSVRYLN